MHILRTYEYVRAFFSSGDINFLKKFGFGLCRVVTYPCQKDVHVQSKYRTKSFGNKEDRGIGMSGRLGSLLLCQHHYLYIVITTAHP